MVSAEATEMRDLKTFHHLDVFPKEVHLAGEDLFIPLGIPNGTILFPKCHYFFQRRTIFNLLLVTFTLLFVMLVMFALF